MWPEYILIRYIYVPLGGMKNVFVNSVLVYTFVALWHDITFKLLAWGWLVSLFILPEMLARYILPSSRVRYSVFYPKLFLRFNAFPVFFRVVVSPCCCLWSRIQHPSYDDRKSSRLRDRYRWNSVFPQSIVWDLGWNSVFDWSDLLLVRGCAGHVRIQARTITGPMNKD